MHHGFGTARILDGLSLATKKGSIQKIVCQWECVQAYLHLLNSVAIGFDGLRRENKKVLSVLEGSLENIHSDIMGCDGVFTSSLHLLSSTYYLDTGIF
jgi:hypothetical protein